MTRLGRPRATQVLLVATALAIAAAETHASAQASSSVTRAEQLFGEGVRLARLDRYAEACPKFEESQRLDPALGTQFDLALCYENVGRLGSAWRNLRAVEQLAHATAKKMREDAAHQKLEELRARVPHLVFVVSPLALDTSLNVDGLRIDRGEWAFYAVDPGDHRVDATAPAKEPWHTVVRTPSSAEANELRVVVPELYAPQGQTRSVTLTKEVTNPTRTAGFILGGIGVVALAAAVATGVVILHEKATANADCKPNCVDQEGRDALSTGKTLLPINVIAWGIGLVGLGVGSFLVLTSKPSNRTVARLAPYAGPHGEGVSIAGEF